MRPLLKDLPAEARGAWGQEAITTAGSLPFALEGGQGLAESCLLRTLRQGPGLLFSEC